MARAVAFMIFGKDGSRLYSSVNPKWMKNLYDIELFVLCALDIVDERSAKTTEMYLGNLYSDQKYKSYGFITNTNIKMILVHELNNSTWNDQNIRGAFKRFHAQFCNALCNPFYVFGTELKSKHLDAASAQIYQES